jgi:hypothetical protein
MKTVKNIKSTIKRAIIKLVAGKDYQAVKGALEFSAYTHNRRGEEGKRDEMNATIARLGLNK